MNSSEFMPRDIGEFANKSRRMRVASVAETLRFPAMLSNKFTSFTRVLSQTGRQGTGRCQDLAQKFFFGRSRKRQLTGPATEKIKSA
jgi:hypothetical protein